MNNRTKILYIGIIPELKFKSGKLLLSILYCSYKILLLVIQYYLTESLKMEIFGKHRAKRLRKIGTLSN